MQGLPTVRHNRTTKRDLSLTTAFLRNNPEERSSHLTRVLPNFALHILISYTLIFRVLRYSSEGRGFDSRWCHSNSSLTLSFRSQYGLWDRISY